MEMENIIDITFWRLKYMEFLCIYSKDLTVFPWDIPPKPRSIRVNVQCDVCLDRLPWSLKGRIYITYVAIIKQSHFFWWVNYKKQHIACKNEKHVNIVMHEVRFSAINYLPPHENRFCAKLTTWKPNTYDKVKQEVLVLQQLCIPWSPIVNQNSIYQTYFYRY